MGQPAAKMGDSIVNAADIHIVLVPSPGGPVPTPQPFPFNGKLSMQMSLNVRINGRPAATVGSMAQNIPPHIPSSGAFQVPPTNLGRVVFGSTTVRINGRGAARMGDICETCHDIPPGAPQAPPPTVVVAGMSNVLIG
ncbi:PAAR domain-containing protein [Burkholderia gladioli]|uniref:PAAR domain-containing protein n=1 Tax=Burkholderia gladioli TaxID=28095 RepID=UPI00163E7597|nr:PAAR domain-containing protein [Burkholderia gladioli]